ncbi:hypothetical protein V5O48_009046 [Marasmius crinis-equi]|uniref:Uncharacterized protein n=1 Tax=Marasmius crinis-equi TaxID=585013 RepID=A0ABR3FCB2_9AGAR
MPHSSSKKRPRSPAPAARRKKKRNVRRGPQIKVDDGDDGAQDDGVTAGEAEKNMMEISYDFLEKMNKIAKEASSGSLGRSLKKSQSKGLNTNPDVACGGSEITLPTELRQKVDQIVRENCELGAALCGQWEERRMAAATMRKESSLRGEQRIREI